MLQRKNLCAAVIVFVLVCMFTKADAKEDVRNKTTFTKTQSVFSDCFITVSNNFYSDNPVFEATLIVKAEKKAQAAKEAEKVKKAKVYYPLSDREREKIEKVLMTSCGDFGYKMAKANAQVILDRLKSKRFGKSVDEVLDSPKQFEKPSSNNATYAVKKAVSDVFDKGERVCKTAIYFYVNPNLSDVDADTWKKGKIYVMTVGKGKYIHEYWTEA